MEPFAIRKQPLTTLHEFNQALTKVYATSSPEVQEAIAVSLFGECVVCGIQVNGRELAEVSVLDPAGATEEGKLNRLRLGYCARNRCKSSIYQLTFRYHPELAWNTLLPSIDENIQGQVEESRRESGFHEGVRRAEQLRAAKKYGMAFAAIALLLVARQWYVGGSIPIIREAEKFRVTPRPLEKVLVGEFQV